MELNTIHNIDALAGLKNLHDESVQCCVTSPPYWGLRDYKVKGQLGMEKSPEEFIDNMVKVFSEVKRALKKDGTLWLNIGDSYASTGKNRTVEQATNKCTLAGSTTSQEQILVQQNKVVSGLKAKDLVGIPWMLAFALRAQGWYLRSDIIWYKRNVMPESVTDRPTKTHEHIFLLSKNQSYFYDNNAIKEPAIYDVDGTETLARKARQHNGNKNLVTDRVNAPRPAGFKDARKMNGKHSNGIAELNANPGEYNEQAIGMRNKRDVWHISPAQFPEAHFATFPEEIPDTCILAGSKEGDTILDPFMGAGTTALVARKRNRNFIGFELNPDYIKIAENRLKKNLGMFQ